MPQAFFADPFDPRSLLPFMDTPILSFYDYVSLLYAYPSFMTHHLLAYASSFLFRTCTLLFPFV